MTTLTAPTFLAAAAELAGPRIRLAGSEGRHAAAVRRLAAGERVDLTDGAGSVAECVVSAAGPDWLDLVVAHRRSVDRPAPWLVVVQALAKGDRGELAVEAMTEVGVDEIVPWAATRSVVQWRGERGAKGLERWRSTAREAAKQSRRAWLPVVPAAACTATVCKRVGAAGLALVLDDGAQLPLAALDVPSTGEVVMVVGPEGGVTSDELAAFTDAGAVACRLGPTVLRTSTAGVVAAAVLLARSGRWA
ncbi:MAG: 16S rRNA (uracil(1498)-N(3))-methyltransferase [Mycobacteriales bacterium]